MNAHVHVIPIPMGMTVEEAWAEICLLGELVDAPPIGQWATIECEGGECRGVLGGST